MTGTQSIAIQRRDRSMQGKAMRWARHHRLKLTRIKDSPDKIAMGASFGVFVGIVPSFGFGMIVAPLVAGLMNWNKIAALAGNFIMNPLTIPFFWGLSAVVGGLIFGADISELLVMVREGSDISIAGLAGGLSTALFVLLAGNLVISILFSLLTYPVVKRWVESQRKRRTVGRQEKIRPA